MAALVPLWARELWGANKSLGDAGLGNSRNAAGVRLPLRRRRPVDANWPSQSAWKRLNDEVEGNLIPVDFPIEPCVKETRSADCQALMSNIHNPYYIGDQPGLTQTLGWVDAWVSKPSVYAVAARNADHIAAAVNFARENDLRLVIKGGGHSYQGTSDAEDSLLVWMRHMHDITMQEAFVPQGCKGGPQKAVTLGAGTIWMQAYDAVTTKAGAYVQGGGCTTVGVAGLVQSGGFGSFSKHYGTAAAGLLEAEVVTSDGKVRIANACTNSDLFWALKGGGGGTFGAISKVTLRAHELPEFFGAAIVRVKAASDEAFRRLLSYFITFYRDHLFNDHWGEHARITGDNVLDLLMVCHDLTPEDVKRIWQPFLDWVARSPGSYTLQGQPILASMSARHWWDVEWSKQHHLSIFEVDQRPGAGPNNAWWTGDSGQVAWFIYGYESLWMPASLLNADSQQRLVRALFTGSRHKTIELHFNKGLAGGPSDAIEATRNTATNPAVLEAFALAIVGDAGGGYPGVRGHEPNVAAGRKARQEIHKCVNELRAIVPNGGAYVSESNFFQEDWQHAYWGSNYGRLAALKKKYDPTGLFFVHNGVGSEGWSDNGFVRKTSRRS